MPEGVTAAYTYNGEETVPTDAGTYEVKATMTGEGWATEVATATLVIEQKGLTVSGLTAEKDYDGSNVIPGELVNGKLEGTVNGDEITPVFPDLTLDSKDAGTYTVACNVELAGDKAANYVLENEAQTLTAKVKPLAVEVTTGDYTKAVGQADPEFVPVFTPELIAGDTYEGALSRKTGEKVNTSYQITKGDLKLNSNYTLTFGELGQLSIVDKVITKVEQVSAPSKLSYVEGEKFDVTGMQVKVTYDNNDEDTAIVDKGFTVDPAFAKRALTTEDNGKKVTVTYNGQPFEFEISVEAKQLTGIELGSKTKTNYYVGNKVNPDKVVVVASYSNADPEEVKGFTLDIDSDYALTLEDDGKVINVSYTYSNVTKTVPMTISVKEAPVGGGGSASASYTIEVTMRRARPDHQRQGQGR